MTHTTQVLSDDEMWILWNAQGSDEMNKDEAIAFARAIESATLEAVSGQEPVAWGLFVRVEDGQWNLQHPVRFKQEDAEADIAMYERTHQFDVRPLYAHAAALQCAQAPQAKGDEA